MSDTYTMTEAPDALGTLVHRVARSHERITITEHGRAAAVLIHPEDLADLEDALAVAEYRRRKAEGTLELIPHEEVRRLLGLNEEDGA
ncbi:type II toxin-antitoxin system Phd/YefM family antitoxin [Streptomyces xiamenensis]|uniref:type II toxin-antitoxin system Phd/YefM family antitoxin n=1 Tax=Streptomyces TaxID=1883 RepID=UPI0004C5F689|nr:type II toxin-antitoxin system Phd/YefM family antitoxin [Streptomyces sp. NRRL F-2890]